MSQQGTGAERETPDLTSPSIGPETRAQARRALFGSRPPTPSSIDRGETQPPPDDSSESSETQSSETTSDSEADESEEDSLPPPLPMTSINIGGVSIDVAAQPSTNVASSIITLKKEDRAGLTADKRHDIDRNESDNTIRLTQKGLTKRIVEALNATQEPIKYTPAVRQPLSKDLDGDPPDNLFSYPSVVGMLLYLSGHSRPDITFAVSQVARFIHGTKRSHEQAILRIGQYLRGTMEEGLILKPDGTMNLECHVDANFAGLYTADEAMDPSCVKSRTGFVISASGCPIVWTSKLQTDIATSTMESEYNALSIAMRDLLPLRTLFETIATGIGLSDELKTTFQTTVWEDNMGCLKLAKSKPGQYTPRSKHYAVKYHWFRSHLSPRTVIEYIDSNLQKADILTKGLPRQKFEEIRKLLCGW